MLFPVECNFQADHFEFENFHLQLKYCYLLQNLRLILLEYNNLNVKRKAARYGAACDNFLASFLEVIPKLRALLFPPFQPFYPQVSHRFHPLPRWLS